MRFETRNLTRSQRLHDFCVCFESPARSLFRRLLDCVEPLHFQDEAFFLAWSQKLCGCLMIHEFGGMISEETLGCGIYVIQAAIETDAYDQCARRIQDVLQRIAGVFCKS